MPSCNHKRRHPIPQNLPRQAPPYIPGHIANQYLLLTPASERATLPLPSSPPSGAGSAVPLTLRAEAEPPCTPVGKIVRSQLNSDTITAQGADELLEKWASEGLPVCFAVCVGNLAWHAHWVGKLRNARDGRWIVSVGGVTNVVCTSEFSEIILTEDEELRGLRFRGVKNSADPNFEVNLFIGKRGELDSESLPLMQKMIQ